MDAYLPVEETEQLKKIDALTFLHSQPSHSAYIYMAGVFDIMECSPYAEQYKRQLALEIRRVAKSALIIGSKVSTYMGEPNIPYFTTQLGGLYDFSSQE